MSKAVYGYIRVSTKEQHENRQRIALDESGVSRKNVFMDKLSGKTSPPGVERVTAKTAPRRSAGGQER